MRLISKQSIIYLLSRQHEIWLTENDESIVVREETRPDIELCYIL